MCNLSIYYGNYIVFEVFSQTYQTFSGESVEYESWLELFWLLETLTY